MATADQIIRLRLLVGEDTQEPYTDESLSARIDTALGNLDRVAYEVWVEKAARYSRLVDISEGGSSRSNSDLFARAQSMAAMFKARLDDAEVDPSNRSGTVVISRMRR